MSIIIIIIIWVSYLWLEASVIKNLAQSVVSRYALIYSALRAKDISPIKSFKVWLFAHDMSLSVWKWLGGKRKKVEWIGKAEIRTAVLLPAVKACKAIFCPAACLEDGTFQRLSILCTGKFNFCIAPLVLSHRRNGKKAHLFEEQLDDRCDVDSYGVHPVQTATETDIQIYFLHDLGVSKTHSSQWSELHSWGIKPEFG